MGTRNSNKRFMGRPTFITELMLIIFFIFIIMRFVRFHSFESDEENKITASCKKLKISVLANSKKSKIHVFFKLKAKPDSMQYSVWIISPEWLHPMMLFWRLFFLSPAQM